MKRRKRIPEWGPVNGRGEPNLEYRVGQYATSVFSEDHYIGTLFNVEGGFRAVLSTGQVLIDPGDRGVEKLFLSRERGARALYEAWAEGRKRGN